MRRTALPPVAKQLEGLNLKGAIKNGERPPSERALAKMFGVSRTVIREAVRFLATMGLLEVTSGSRVLVRSPTPESVAQSMGLFLKAGRPEVGYDKVHEVRRALEVDIAGLAAERRTEQDPGGLEAIIQKGAQVSVDRYRFTRKSSGRVLEMQISRPGPQRHNTPSKPALHGAVSL